MCAEDWRGLKRDCRIFGRMKPSKTNDHTATNETRGSGRPLENNQDRAKILRSRNWFGKTDKMGFIYRSWMKNQGFPEDLFDGRPVIGICNTWSELTPCNAHLRDIAEWVKRG